MTTLSKSPGIGGEIKRNAEDFLVEEITESGKVLELGKSYNAGDLGFAAEGVEDAKFAIFILQKKNWNTAQALMAIARKVNRGIKSMSFAGTKDRASVSTQLCGAFGVKPEAMARIHIKDISINGAWLGREKIKMGGLLGNRFTVTVRNPSAAENAAKIADELGGIFPNYFGEQRFGFRENNVEIGLNIIRGDFEGAAMKYLTDTKNEMNADAVDARTRLGEEKDFAKALGYFPAYLKYERMIIDHLAGNPTDYAGALRKLPRNLTLMFVHSVDSYIFNKEIEDRIDSGVIDPQDDDDVCLPDANGFPQTDSVYKMKDAIGKDAGSKKFITGNILGYDSAINAAEQSILDELGITLDQFHVKSMPELNCKGGRRVLFAPYLGFAQETGENMIMRFSLASGSYATVLLDEFLKN